MIRREGPAFILAGFQPLSFTGTYSRYTAKKPVTGVNSVVKQKEEPGMVLKDTLLYLAHNQHLRDFVVHNKTARGISRRFVAGEVLDDAIQATRMLNQRHIQVALDHLGENVSDEQEAKAATQDYIAALDQIKQTGIDANISVKLTALGLDISREVCEQNLVTILQCAAQNTTFVCIDMEGSAYTADTVDITLQMRRQFEHIGTVIQSYMYRSRKDIEQLISEGVRVRLVKGAYKEPSSIAYQSKDGVDRNYVQLMMMLLSRGNFPAIATMTRRLSTRPANLRAIMASVKTHSSFRCSTAFVAICKKNLLVRAIICASTFLMARNGIPTSCDAWLNGPRTSCL